LGDHPPTLSETLAGAIADVAHRIEKPLAVQWSAGALSLPGISRLGQEGVPVLTEPGRCLHAIAACLRTGRARLRATTVQPSRPPRSDWSESEGKRLLAEIGIPSPPPPSPDGQAVVKADCVGSVHKTELGAVLVGVHREDIDAAAARVAAAARDALGEGRVRGVIVEARVRPICELVLSVHRDPQLGAIVTVGAGGELVELLRDTASRLAPVGLDEAYEMLDELRSGRLIDGFRGRPRGDRASVAQAIARLSELGASWGDALEIIETNPLAVLEDGVAALDVLIEVNKEALR